MDSEMDVDKIKPCFKRLHWVFRVGLIMLFPPIFMLIAIPIGIVITAPFGSSDVIAGLMGYVVAVCLLCIIAFKIYYGTSFDVNDSGVTYNLNFLWSRRKSVLFRNIKEIELKIGFLQKFFGLGTVVLHTQVGVTNGVKVGVSLFDIENSKKVYELLRQQVEGSFPTQ